MKGINRNEAIVAFLLIIVLLVVTYLILNMGNKDNNQNQIFNNSKLTSREIQALQIVLDREYRTKETYWKTIDTFGKIEPFETLIQSQDDYPEVLKSLFTRYSLQIPTDSWYKKIAKFDSTDEACNKTRNLERENINTYDELMPLVSKQDILDTFQYLQIAHQSALEKLRDC